MRAREFIIESTEREIAQAQYMQGECAVLALTIRNMNPQRFTLGFVYEFFDSSPDMYLEPDEFDELDPARQQDIKYSYQNWTLTHAYVYDVLTREYIDAEGRHKQLPMIGRDLNATRHNKFPAETQDLVNVSHYMEWDEAQEKWIVLQGWDAVDKAYTPEDKQRAREYAIKYLGIDRPAQAVAENFADGRNPQDKGDAKRHGINTKASVSSLRKTAKQGGRKGQLAHWLANMKAGRAKKKKTNETTIGHLQFPRLTIAIDDHAVDRTRTRGINPHAIDQSLKKLNSIADQLAQVEPNTQVWAYDPETQLGLGMRRISSQNMLFKLKTVVNSRPFDGPIPIIDLS